MPMSRVSCDALTQLVGLRQSTNLDLNSELQPWRLAGGPLAKVSRLTCAASLPLVGTGARAHADAQGRTEDAVPVPCDVRIDHSPEGRVLREVLNPWS